LKGRVIYLSDFGLAFHPNSESDYLSNHTSSASGTETYKAPEMGASYKYSRRADVFSFGCVLLELLLSANNVDLNDFVEFRKANAKGVCHRSDHAYRHNLEAVHLFAQQFIKRVNGVDKILNVILSEMLTESAALRSGSTGVWYGILEGAKAAKGFVKENCCEDDDWEGQGNISMQSLAERIEGLTLNGQPVNVKFRLRSERPFRWPVY
jgi:serine/threonine protein kinase